MLVCLSIDLAYLIGICMSEEENTSTVYSMDMDFYFTFIAQKGESDGKMEDASRTETAALC